MGYKGRCRMETLRAELGSAQVVVRCQGVRWEPFTSFGSFSGGVGPRGKKKGHRRLAFTDIIEGQWPAVINRPSFALISPPLRSARAPPRRGTLGGRPASPEPRGVPCRRICPPIGIGRAAGFIPLVSTQVRASPISPRSQTPVWEREGRIAPGTTCGDTNGFIPAVFAPTAGINPAARPPFIVAQRQPFSGAPGPLAQWRKARKIQARQQLKCAPRASRLAHGLAQLPRARRRGPGGRRRFRRGGKFPPSSHRRLRWRPEWRKLG